jgi:ABC-2 type transport system ATP-binding protein
VNDAIIEVVNLVKRYGAVEAVRGVSFLVGEGEVFGLLGPNGAGKTSTVEILEGLRRADGGTVTVCGLDPERRSTELKQ